MITRREAVGVLVAAPVAAVTLESDSTKESSQLVVPPGAIKRFEEIAAQGGKITGITIHYSLPTQPGFMSSGSAFLFRPGECEWELK